MVQDFAENRKAVYAAEIKSAHFGKGQITVHPMVCFYRVGECIVRHTVIIMSDDIGHDHHAVNSFTLAAVDILKQQRPFSKLTMWSDGAASQYKGRGSFADLSLMTGLDVQRCFYGSEHGKGEADGETGVLSQILRRATGRGMSFSDAGQMLRYLQTNHTIDRHDKKRQFLLLNNIDRERPESEAQTIPGTRSYHQFQRVGPYLIQARRFACFCSGCVVGKYELCLYKHVIGSYITHKLKPNAQTLNEGFMEDNEHSHPQSSSNEDSVKIGDFLKVTCTINRLERTFYAVVTPSPVETSDFYVQFLKKTGTNAYVFGDVPDEGLIYKGPPDNYRWEVIPTKNVVLDNRGHHYFKC